MDEYAEFSQLITSAFTPAERARWSQLLTGLERDCEGCGAEAGEACFNFCLGLNELLDDGEERL